MQRRVIYSCGLRWLTLATRPAPNDWCNPTRFGAAGAVPRRADDLSAARPRQLVIICDRKDREGSTCQDLPRAVDLRTPRSTS